MMAGLLSLVTTLISLLFAVQVTRQYEQRRKPQQLVWAVAMFFFGAGTACQLAGAVAGWSPALYRIWYLTGAVLTAAYLGQGTVYLQAKRRTAHLTMALLLLASVGATVAVFRAPVRLEVALAGPSVSGAGMPRNVRLLTPFFNIFGTVMLVGGAARSSWYFIWSGHSDRLALGTGLIALGSFVVALGGTLTRFSVPEALYVTELAGVVTIYLGFVFTSQPFSASDLTEEQLLVRRQRIARLGVRFGATLLLGAVIILPLLPWSMGIVTDAKHVFIESVPEENKGAYLVTDQGIMQLYTWRVEPATFPSDAPTLPRDAVMSVAIVQKQFDPAPSYRLYNLTTEHAVTWQSASRGDLQLHLEIDTLEAGDYMLVVPTDSMFGGKAWHYFRLQ